MDVDTFLQMIASRYRPKMEEYRSAVIDAGIQLPVKPCLYLPAVDRFLEL